MQSQEDQTSEHPFDNREEEYRGESTVSSESAGEYLKPYEEALEMHGPSFEATLWVNRETQIQRFDIIADMLDPTGLRLLDAGCARGELLHRLVEVNRIPKCYIGLDAFADFIHAAHELHPEKGCDVILETADFVRDPTVFKRFSPDVIVFSGSLNTLTQEQALSVVGKAFKAAEKGVVFNFLSDRHHPRFDKQDTGPARRFSATEVVAWALEQTPCVRFRQDYFDGHDATVCLKHMKK